MVNLTKNQICKLRITREFSRTMVGQGIRRLTSLFTSFESHLFDCLFALATSLAFSTFTFACDSLKPKCQFDGNQDNILQMVETRTIQSDLNIDVLPPLVVVFSQFKICMWFPRALSLSANKTMAIDRNLPYFIDKTVINKYLVFIRCHAKLISVFVRLGLLRRISCLSQVKETNIRCYYMSR